MSRASELIAEIEGRSNNQNITKPVAKSRASELIAQIEGQKQTPEPSQHGTTGTWTPNLEGRLREQYPKSMTIAQNISDIVTPVSFDYAKNIGTGDVSNLQRGTLEGMGGLGGSMVGGIPGGIMGYAGGKKLADIVDVGLLGKPYEDLPKTLIADYLLNKTPASTGGIEKYHPQNMLIDFLKQTPERGTISGEFNQTGRDIIDALSLQTIGEMAKAGVEKSAPTIKKAYGFVKSHIPWKTQRNIEQMAGDQLRPMIENIEENPIYSKTYKESRALEKEIPNVKYTLGQASGEPEAIMAERTLARGGVGATPVKHQLQRVQGGLAGREYVQSHIPPQEEGIDDVIAGIKSKEKLLGNKVKQATQKYDSTFSKVRPRGDASTVSYRSGKEIFNKGQELKGAAYTKASERFTDLPDIEVNAEKLYDDMVSLKEEFVKSGYKPENFPTQSYNELLNKIKVEKLPIQRHGANKKLPTPSQSKILDILRKEGVEIDSENNIKIYHGTSKKAAEIIKSGKMHGGDKKFEMEGNPWFTADKEVAKEFAMDAYGTADEIDMKGKVIALKVPFDKFHFGSIDEFKKIDPWNSYKKSLADKGELFQIDNLKSTNQFGEGTVFQIDLPIDKKYTNISQYIEDVKPINYKELHGIVSDFGDEIRQIQSQSGGNKKLGHFLNKFTDSLENTIKQVGDINPKALESFDEARQLYKEEYIEPFRQGTARDVFVRGAGGSDSKLDYSAIPNEFTKNMDTAKDYTRVFGQGDKEIKDVMMNEMFNDSLNSTTKQINIGKARAWYGQNRGILRELGIEDDFKTLIKSQKMLDKTAENLTGFNKSILAKVLNADPQHAIDVAMSGNTKNTGAAMRSIIQSLPSDKTPVGVAAKKGLQKAFVDYIFDKSQKQLASDVAEEVGKSPIVNIQKRGVLLQQFDPALKELFKSEPQKYAALRNYQKNMEVIQRNFNSPFGGGSDTKELLAADSKRVMGVLAQGFGAKVKIFRILSGYYENGLKAKVNQIMERALLDPDYAFTLVKATSNPTLFKQRMDNHLIELGAYGLGGRMVPIKEDIRQQNEQRRYR